MVQKKNKVRLTNKTQQLTMLNASLRKTLDSKVILQKKSYDVKSLNQIKSLGGQLTKRTKFSFQVLNLTLKDIVIPDDKSLQYIAQSKDENLLKLYRKKYQQNRKENIKKIETVYKMLNEQGFDNVIKDKKKFEKQIQQEFLSQERVKKEKDKKVKKK